MRVVPFLIWTVVVLALILPALRRATFRQRPTTDELVKDPVCQTYVVRSRAVVRRHDGDRLYFCSSDCARRYAALT